MRHVQRPALLSLVAATALAGGVGRAQALICPAGCGVAHAGYVPSRDQLVSEIAGAVSYRGSRSPLSSRKGGYAVVSNAP